MVHSSALLAALALSFQPICLATANLRNNEVEDSNASFWERQLSKSMKSKSKITLPEINDIMNKAFPMWEVDEEGRRVEKKRCTVDTCEWNPHYITKRYDGLHPDLGGHPTDLDVRYVFFGPSPFAGQPYQGTPHHCNINDSDDIKAGDCPKIKTKTDSGADGPGHVPPHISLASLTWAVRDDLFSLDEMFHYEFYGCRVTPDVLLKMIRKYYPRTDGDYVEYPPPIVPEGGDYQVWIMPLIS